MGMYTEIYVNVDLKKDIPEEIINTLKAICDVKPESRYLQDKPSRWPYLFNNGSYYTPNTRVSSLTFDKISRQYSLLGKGDIKNYEGEIEDFFEFIKPHSDTKFMGYHRYEEFEEPTLVYSDFID